MSDLEGQWCMIQHRKSLRTLPLFMSLNGARTKETQQYSIHPNNRWEKGQTMAKTFWKIVEEIPEVFDINTDTSTKPWIRSWSEGINNGHVVKIGRQIDVKFFTTREELNEFITRRNEQNNLPHEPGTEWDTTKTIYIGRVSFDDTFVDAVKKAYTICRSFGEFGFAERKNYKAEFKKNYGTDRDKIAYIKWALRW